MKRLDPIDVKQRFTEQLQSGGRVNLLDKCRQLQLTVYVMCGGGLLGRLAAEQPSDFYIDDRAGKTNYPKKEIYQAVEVLKVYAEVLGLNPSNLDPSKELNFQSFMNHHNCGVF